MRFRPIYLFISGLALIASCYAITVWGFKYSIDFTGGSVVEYKFPNQSGLDTIQTFIISKGYSVKEGVVLSKNNLQFRFGPDFTQPQAELIAQSAAKELNNEPIILRFETVGPTLSEEILRKTYVAIGLASLGILLWVAWQFKSIKFGVSAILAMLHDSIVLLGTFAVLGHFKGVEIDILFVTAMLTVLSFSVHDTIVVYDRIRESMRRYPSTSIYDLANRAVTDTMVRSVNNSLTIIFMLFALFLMGGLNIKWFVFALLIGTVSGTYSSPFVAVPLLVTWEQIKNYFRKK